MAVKFLTGVQIRRLKDPYGKYNTSAKKECACCSEYAIIQIAFSKKPLLSEVDGDKRPKVKHKYIYLCEKHKNDLTEYLPYFK